MAINDISQLFFSRRSKFPERHVVNNWSKPIQSPDTLYTPDIHVPSSIFLISYFRLSYRRRSVSFLRLSCGVCVSNDVQSQYDH